MNTLMCLRWRPPECLWYEIPLAKAAFSHQTECNHENLEELYNEDVLEEGIEKHKTTEILLSHFQDPAVDIYSLGVIINEIWSRNIPFSGSDPDFDSEFQLLESVSKGEVTLEIASDIPNDVSLEIYNNLTPFFPYS